MLFKDGKRIDLHIRVKEFAIKEYVTDSLTITLIDKDNCLPKIPPTNDSDYYIKKPPESRFLSCCNNFWWCLQNVAKGIARDQLSYAMWMYNSVVRDDLTIMIDWYIGMGSDFSVSIGMKSIIKSTYRKIFIQCMQKHILIATMVTSEKQYLMLVSYFEQLHRVLPSILDIHITKRKTLI